MLNEKHDIQRTSQNHDSKCSHVAGKVNAHITATRRQADHISQDGNARTRILLSDITDYLGQTETDVNDTKQELQAKEILG